MTQIDLAEAAGTTQRAVSYYENAFGFPPAPVLVALAKALRVTTDELLGVKRVRPDSRTEDPETRYHIYVQQKIDQGLAASERGDFIADDEIERRIAHWAGE